VPCCCAHVARAINERKRMTVEASQRFDNGESEPTASAAPDQTGPAAAGRLREQLAELAEYWRYYLSARADQLKISVQRVVFGIALGLVGLLVAAALAVTSTVVLVMGIAEGLGQAFGDRLWLGYTVTGVVILLGIVISLYLVVYGFLKASRARMVRKYEQRRQQQAARFGHDLEGQIAGQRISE
jgi:hypothetical protein